MALLDLETQLTFYGSYHSHHTNILIHIIFVPILMFGLFSLAALCSLPNLLPTSILPDIYSNLSTLTALLYATLYILMEPLAGCLFAPLVVGQSLLGTWCMQHYGSGEMVYWVLWSQLVAWGMQFVGHGVFEKRAPALKDNVVQALFLAPFFVWIECLWMGGYRPELRERVEGKVAAVKRELKEKWEREERESAVGKKEL